MKRFLYVGVGLVAVIAIGIGIYYYQLTADFEVSDEVPVAPTIAAPNSAAAAQPSPITEVDDALAYATEAPAAQSPTQAATEAPAPAETVASATQIYKIDATQSTATYTVNETFLSESRDAQAIGTTNALDGQILIDTANPAASQVGDIIVDISQLTSDSSRRDNALRREWLESGTFPLATFSNIQILNLPDNVQEGVPFQVQLQGDLNMHDTTNPVTWDATLLLENNVLRGSASTVINMPDFNITPPDIAGTISSEDTAQMGLNFVALPVQP